MYDLETNWEMDRVERALPGNLTTAFHTSVPVLKYLDWKVVETRRGFAASLLPLNIHSTNQHITHQAAVILIAADYTGGIALGTLLHGVPLVGIHPQNDYYGAYLWGAKAEIRWIRPSTADLICEADIPRERHDQIVKRFFSGRRVLETVHVEMKNRSGVVAEANITYWVQNTEALRRDAFDERKVHVLYDHRHATSAHLIAGLRALEQRVPVNERLFEDPVAITLAGLHGTVLAERFCSVAPQIQPMVASRTRHLDDLVARIHNGHPCQIVNIGVGLDSRMFRVALPSGSKVFDLDLPVMLRRRTLAVEAIPKNGYPARVEVPIDLQLHDIAEAVTRSDHFDSELPCVVVWEGGSMYFGLDNFHRIIASISGLLKHPKSRLWLDYVDSSVIDGTSGFSVVDDFTNAMRCLGEPFITGFRTIDQELMSHGLVVEEDIPSRTLLQTENPVFDLYKFCVVRSDIR